MVLTRSDRAPNASTKSWLTARETPTMAGTRRRYQRIARCNSGRSRPPYWAIDITVCSVTITGTCVRAPQAAATVFAYGMKLMTAVGRIRRSNRQNEYAVTTSRRNPRDLEPM